MIIFTDPKEFQSYCLARKAQGLRAGLVPTMGFFHDGHLSLMEYARQRADTVVVSLFVNPIQFAPGEDLDAYPRDHERDRELAESRGVDVLFLPEPSAMYAPDHSTTVNVDGLDKPLCGGGRPGHFRGVCTVVSKLFLLAQPDFAVFGEKDWQQLAIIRRMVRDLSFPVEIAGRPIVRERDGLALSSRNVYLSPEERRQAPGIQAGLRALEGCVSGGERDTANLRRILREYYAEHVPLARPDYIEFVHPENLTPVTRMETETLAAVALRIGKARLIDNLLLRV